MKVLKVKPYNDLWFDCINNNIIGILAAYEPSFTRLPTFYNGTYSINVKAEDVQADTNDLSPHIDVLFEWPDLTRIFEEKQVEVSADHSIVEVVRRFIDDNYYVFMYIDRYYFPDTPNYNKESFIHPTLIYGYTNNNFKLLEDCVKVGNMDYYEIENSMFTQAFLSSLRKAGTTIVHCIRLKEEWPTWDMNISRDLAITLLQNVLHTQEMSESSGTTIQGIGALAKYAELFERESKHIAVHPDKFMWFYQQLRRGIVLQKRNILILQNLHEQGILNADSYHILSKMYQEHQDCWTFVTNKIGFIMYKNIEKKSNGKLQELKELVLDLYKREHKLLTVFINHIHG
ncbi:hypothetical protein [Paenibacillus tyrfis]|uniref:Butirosin biosynthesis protein H N-terminal domain-containing protein n=1 Tax=Paenibacillus tyrfis TaxID=1501230 RepID=A0A081NTN4_9BACL|nr:hypothetical protein [Paenibacillus tyrfis]KEQ21807.1 hypothetical protein ET33_30825 [Paenibacillus tyrfis]